MTSGGDDGDLGRAEGPVAPPPVVSWTDPGTARPSALPPLPIVLAGFLAAFVALIVVVVLSSGAMTSHPSGRQLPPPIRDAVVLVPLGAFPSDKANEIAGR
ncbi:MAG TPA: hypothetical protein VIM20_11540, partial [Candidatus Limnocylindrales bacterium]